MLSPKSLHKMSQGDGSGLLTGNWDQTKLDIVGDITAIPRPDAAFDGPMCTDVFENFPGKMRGKDIGSSTILNLGMHVLASRT